MNFLYQSLILFVTLSTTAIPVVRAADTNFKVRLLGADGKPLSPQAVQGSRAWEWIVLNSGAAGVVEAQCETGADDIVTLRPTNQPAPATWAKVIIEVRSPEVGVGSLRLDRSTTGVQDIQLKPGVTLTGRAVDEAGKPISETQIQIERLIGSAMPLRIDLGNVQSDADGRFRIPNLFPEHCAVRVSLNGSNGEDDNSPVPPGWKDVDLSQSSSDIVLCPADPTPTHLKGIQPTYLRGRFDLTQQSPDTVNTRLRVDPAGALQLPRITGRVQLEDGAPAGGILLALNGLPNQGLPFMNSTRSAADGSYSLIALHPGDYNVEIVDDNWRSSTQPVILGDDRQAVVNFKLIPLPGVRLRLQGLDGKPLAAGLKVYLAGRFGGFPTQLSQRRVLTTGQGGIIEIFADPVAEALRPPGQAANGLDSETQPWRRRLQAVVNVPGLGSAFTNLPDWPAGPLPFQLQPYRTLCGRVLDAAGHGIKAARINLYPARTGDPAAHQDGDAPAASVITDAAGRFELGSLSESRYFLSASAGGPPDENSPDNWASSETVQKPPGVISLEGQRVNLGSGRTDIVVTPFDRAPPAWSASTLTVPVSDPSGRPMKVQGRVRAILNNQPVPGALVLLYSTDASPACASAFAGPNGSFQLQTSRAGRYHLTIVCHGRIAADNPLAIPAAHPVVYSVHEDPTLRIRVIGSTGKPFRETVEVDAVLSSSTTRWRYSEHPSQEAVLPTAAPIVYLYHYSPRRLVRRRPRHFTKPGLYGMVTLTPDIAVTTGEIERIDLRIRAAGAGCAAVTLWSWPDAPITVRLKPGLTLRGQVVDTKGRPAARIQVKAGYRFSGSPGDEEGESSSAPTGPDGRFSFPNMLPGIYRVHAQFNSDQTPVIGVIPDSGPVSLVWTGDTRGLGPGE